MWVKGKKLIANPSTYFSDEANEMKASAIRELLKVVKSGDVLSMAGGMPNPKSFPIDMINELAETVLKERGADALQYGTTAGYQELRKAITNRMEEKFNINTTPDNMLITAGSQQGLHLISRVFINPGDKIILGAPTYLAALTAFKPSHPDFVPIPLDNNGMKINKLKTKLEEMEEPPKFLYTVPTFQNPRGVTMSKERRKQLLELASEYNFLIVEDGPYNELRYEGKDIDPIKSMDNQERVLFLGTFSKILAPGFRIGWMIGHEDFIRKIEIAKQSVDLCTNVFSQHIACEYMKTGKMEDQIQKIKKLYNRKRKIALDALEKHMPEEVEWTEPEGGMFLWAKVPKGINTHEIFEDARKNGIAYVPGKHFYAKNPKPNTMRINYTFLSDEKIPEGIRRIAKTIRENM